MSGRIEDSANDPAHDIDYEIRELVTHNEELGRPNPI